MGGMRSKPISVAICSRDSAESHKWLRHHLDGMFKNTKVDFRPVYITNNPSEFNKEIRSYHFAILYHTKNRGRVNLTNVTDSLYDDELRSLHDYFGRKGIVVVIDDLENSEENEKRKIQNGQPDLQKHACDVILFSVKEKHDLQGLERKLKSLKKEIKTGKKKIRIRKDRNSIPPNRKTHPARSQSR